MHYLSKSRFVILSNRVANVYNFWSIWLIDVYETYIYANNFPENGIMVEVVLVGYLFIYSQDVCHARWRH